MISKYLEAYAMRTEITHLLKSLEEGFMLESAGTSKDMAETTCLFKAAGFSLALTAPEKEEKLIKK